MVFKTAEELINSYLNKTDFLMLIDVELPKYEWDRVREYCFDNSRNNPELHALLAEMYIYALGVDAFRDDGKDKTYKESEAAG